MASILVVEDDEDNAELIRRFLRREGHCVYHAPTGLAALTLAAEQIPDLIIMDIGLPGWISACRACRVVKRHSVFGATNPP
jgi:CheY-like chemotaxis protein